MKRTLAIIAVLGMSTAISGCFLSSEDKPAAAPAQAQTGPLWKLSLQSNCAGDAAECVAAYGFAVTAEGKYFVGPSPTGKTATGSLTSEEFEILNEKLAALSSPDADAQASAANAATAAPQEACQAITNAENDKLVLTREGKERTLAQTHEAQLCYQTANPQAAAELHDLVKELARRYYPLPFPNACADQVSALEGLYASVQSCSADADCVYVDQFQAVPPSSDQWVSTNTCTPVKTLAVASNKALLAQKDGLAQAYKAALSACGFAAENVNSCDGLKSSVGAPVCQQGVCRVHPAPQQ